MGSDVRAVLFGCGRWGMVLLKSALKVGIEIVGLVEPDLDRLTTAARLVPHCSDIRGRWTGNLDVPGDANAMIIASPPPTHAELVKLGLERGLHVFCEKPLAMNKKELDSIVVPYGLILQVGYQYAHMPVLRFLPLSEGPIQMRGLWYNAGQVRDDIDSRLNTLVHPASMMASLLWDSWLSVENTIQHSWRIKGEMQDGVCTSTGLVRTVFGDVYFIFDTSWAMFGKRREFILTTVDAEFVYDDVAKTLHKVGKHSEGFNKIQEIMSPVEVELVVFLTAVISSEPRFLEPDFTRLVYRCLMIT